MEGGGFGYRDWNITLPAPGGQWPERDEFHSLSDRAFQKQLRPVRSGGPMRQGDVVVVSVVRNEELRLPLFFEHYKKLGVARFLMIDNDSEDATPDLLLAEPLADVFHTKASYLDACCGLYWLNGVARARAIGHWTVMADADELLVYDGMAEHGLPAFAAWLERNRQPSLFTPMIDIYPRDVVGEAGGSLGDNLAGNSWFDTAGYALQRRNGGWVMTGGPRHRLFGGSSLIHGDWLSKYPFLRMSEEAAFAHAHLSWPGDAGPARPLAALVHLKFMDDFADRSKRNESEGEHYGQGQLYRVINQKLAVQPRLVAHNARSALYTGPDSLIRHNLLLPIDWQADGSQKLAHRRTLGEIDRREWTGVKRPLTIPPGEREEFEDLSRRAFAAHLTPVRCRGRLAAGEIGLICVLRNEEARLPLFFEHYKRLGVARFFMIDNGSDDATRDMLIAEPRADIFHASAPLSEGQDGLYWAQAVARLHGEGTWLLRADADELFVYERMEERDLAAFAAWLDEHDMDRVYAPLIDLYPAAPSGSPGLPLAEQLKSDSWFDNDGYSLARWPQGWRLVGGPRHRLFHRPETQPEPIGKYPFFHMWPETIIYSDHWLWPHDKVTTGALGAVVKLMHREAPESQMAFYDGSKRYRGPRSLVRHGMLMPIDWESSPPAFSDSGEVDHRDTQ